VEVDKIAQEVYLKRMYMMEIMDLTPGSYITVSNTDLKKDPGGQTIGSLKKGAQFEKVEQNGKWTKVRVEGWVWTPATQE